MKEISSEGRSVRIPLCYPNPNRTKKGVIRNWNRCYGFVLSAYRRCRTFGSAVM